MDFEQARFYMVEQQIRPWGVLDPHVLDTLMNVKRELFVPPAHRNLAFADIQIPLGFDQVMLEPKIEAKVLQALRLKKSDNVLEVGTGSGYMAALLAAHAEWVRSIEIIPELANFAHVNLARAGIENVIVEEGDAINGWGSRAPYDAIVLSGAVPEVSLALLSQLKVGGRLLAFVGQAPVMEAQLITRVAEAEIVTQNIFETVVPALKCKAVSQFTF